MVGRQSWGAELVSDCRAHTCIQTGSGNRGRADGRALEALTSTTCATCGEKLSFWGAVVEHSGSSRHCPAGTHGERLPKRGQEMQQE